MADHSIDHYQHDNERKTNRPDSTDSPSSTNGDIDAANISEASLLRKIDWRLLPAVGILYLLSFLDRSNVANAKIEGLATDLGMSE